MHWLLLLTKLSVSKKKKKNFFGNCAVVSSATQRPKKKVPGAPIPKDIAHHCFVRQFAWQHAERDEVSRVVDFVFVYGALDAYSKFFCCLYM